jgi:small subunit ribosomal protein S14
LAPLKSFEKGIVVMAKKSSIEKNKRRMRMVASKGARRDILRAIIKDKTVPLEERFAASIKLSEEPRDSSPSRIRNRCEITGRPRGYYRKLKMSRIALRDLASFGQIPGIVKSSW